jgi:FkbM family methyltransferase
MIIINEKEMIEAIANRLRNDGVKKPVIIDVGANRGHWIKIFDYWWSHCVEANDAQAILIEPNPDLATYLRVEFAGRGFNILETAIGEVNGQQEMNFFNDRYHELSSFIVPLNHSQINHVYKKNVNCLRLDNYLLFPPHLFPKIAILKIDVEGAEFLVLKGAKNMLNNNAPEYIQVEYSNSYHCYGNKFTELIEYMEQYGYKAYDFDGEKFSLLTKENFIEDYRLENFVFSLHNLEEEALKKDAEVEQKNEDE